MYTTKNARHGAEIFPQMDRMLNEIFNTTISHATDEKKSKYSQPSANVKEFNDRFEIYLAVPGMQKSDIAVKIEKNVLAISATVESDQAEGVPKFKLKEYSYGVFSRKFKLPETVDITSVDAGLKDGILTITIAKKADEVDNGPKEIAVK